MRRTITIQGELIQIHTVEDLTQVFESIASMHIAKIRDRVVASKQFFAELWPTYRSLRIDPKERLARPLRTKKGRSVFLAITAEGKLGGEIDEQIIDQLVAAHKKPETTDIMVVGTRGQTLLRQKGLSPLHLFPVPVSDISIDVSDMIKLLGEYDQISVFYQTYESLREQKPARIELLTAIRELGEDVSEDKETVSSRDYIFEPGINEIADYMESVMMGVALIQVMMESKLAGYAARFNAMNRAKHRAGDLVADYRLQYYRAKRSESDERLKEIMKVVKAHERRWAS